MKKWIASALGAAMLLSLATAAFAAEPLLIAPAPAEESRSGYALQIDGEDTGVRACIMVPLRSVAEKLGFEVVWNGDGTIFLDDGTMHSTVTLGEDLYQVTTSVEGMLGMSAPFSLGMAPCAMDGVTYVPLGLFDALLGSMQRAVTMEDGTVCLDTDPLNKAGIGGVQLPNPFAEYETLAEAARAAGVELTAPDSVNGSDRRTFRAIENDLLEVIYSKGEEEIAHIRKAAGAGDISGDYNVYPQVDTVTVNGAEVMRKGDAGKVSLATWTAGEYTYSISVESGISAREMTRLISAVR